MYQWRVTKYNPALRNAEGHFTGDEWYCLEQVGEVLEGKLFTVQDYLAMEDKYVQAAKIFMEASGRKEIEVTDLVQFAETPPLVKELGLDDLQVHLEEGQKVDIEMIQKVLRMMLRGSVGCKLQFYGDFFIHVGWDMYMYIGSYADLPKAVKKVQKLGLYVEPFVSPQTTKEDEEYYFIDSIDCNFPYDDGIKAEAIIEEAATHSPDALYYVIYELCHLPVSVNPVKTRPERLRLLDLTLSKISHPSKDVIEETARRVISGEELSVEEIAQRMRIVANHPFSGRVLGILSVSCYDKDGVIDAMGDEIYEKWLEKLSDKDVKTPDENNNLQSRR